MPPPTPTELAVGPVVTHETNTLEGLLTWTYARVWAGLQGQIETTTMEVRKYPVTGMASETLCRPFTWEPSSKRAHYLSSLVVAALLSGGLSPCFPPPLFG